MIAEVEKRYPLFGQTGRVLITGYDSRGRMALLDQAIALGEATNTTPDPALVRHYRSRLGASLDLEQPLTADLGVFGRVGKSQGNVEGLRVLGYRPLRRAGRFAQGHAVASAGRYRRPRRHRQRAFPPFASSI